MINKNALPFVVEVGIYFTGTKCRIYLVPDSPVKGYNLILSIERTNKAVVKVKDVILKLAKLEHKIATAEMNKGMSIVEIFQLSDKEQEQLTKILTGEVIGDTINKLFFESVDGYSKQ